MAASSNLVIPTKKSGIPREIPDFFFMSGGEATLLLLEQVANTLYQLFGFIYLLGLCCSSGRVG